MWIVIGGTAECLCAAGSSAVDIHWAEQEFLVAFGNGWPITIIAKDRHSSVSWTISLLLTSS
jgi:hypothetical protein